MALRIAAVCAFSDGRNSGMVSVDAGLLSFLERHRIEARVDLFTLSKPLVLEGVGPGFPQLRYQVLEDPRQLDQYDRILYWGDFLLSRRFQEKDLKSWQGSRSDAAFEDHLMRLLLLEGASDATLGKVICFGGALQINGPQHDADGRYRAAIGRLFSRARLVLTRDPLSAAFAEAYGAPGSALGVDAAFLFEPETGGASGAAVGRAFGRTRRRYRFTRWGMRRFAQHAAKAAGTEVTAIDWLGSDPAAPLGSLKAQIVAIRACSLIVTDIYHCAITAWREGVPAVCFGFGTQHATNTLSDKKKELLYGMFNARPFYVFSEQVRWPLGVPSLARAAVAAARDAQIVGAIRSNIATHVERSEKRLLEALVRD